ncbi:MAG: hypothetical protein B7Y99_04485 [Caulobacterales bacterium 32-69-10]|nr:MAG: hypothetical protein B7Y99_04485 [Caulobacterales bacterium 32-69-10]
MSQNDRGAYTPQTDAPLAFDARPPRGGRRPLPMALIGSAAVLLVLIIAVVMYYQSGVRGPGTQTAVGDPVGVVKTAPAANAQGAGEDPFSNLDVYASQNVPNAAPASAPAFAPAPETPQPRPAPAPVPAPGLRVQTVESNPVQAVPAPARDAAPVRTAQLPPAAAPAAPVAVASASGAAVQIGAFSSTALADKGYSDIAAAFPGPMAGKAKRVETVAREGQAPLYRGLIGGFASREAAQAFCNTLKAAGRNCLVRG